MHKIAIPQAAIDRVLKRRDSLHVFNDLDPAPPASTDEYRTDRHNTSLRRTAALEHDSEK